MIGGFEFQPPGRITPRLRVRPGVRFGKPLDFSRYYGMESDGLVLRAVTDEIIYEIMKLSGKEYVDVYAARHKARQHAERRAHRHDGAAKAKSPDMSAAGEAAAGPAAAGDVAAGPAAGEEAAGEAAAGPVAAGPAAGDASAAEPGEAAAGEAGAAGEAAAAEAGGAGGAAAGAGGGGG